MSDLAPWEQRFRGKRWSDMPGSDPTEQKLNFALWRRGLRVVVDDETASNGVRLSGPSFGTIPSLARRAARPAKESKVEVKLATPSKPKRSHGPNGLPPHMTRKVPLEDALATQRDVARVAGNAGMSLSEAARRMGIRRTAFAVCEVERSTAKIMGYMKQFLEMMEAK